MEALTAAAQKQTFRALTLSTVMAGLVPAIHVFELQTLKTWMPGTRPGMTSQLERIRL
jgi:hypothetical protein